MDGVVYAAADNGVLVALAAEPARARDRRSRRGGSSCVTKVCRAAAFGGSRTVPTPRSPRRSSLAGYEPVGMAALRTFLARPVADFPQSVIVLADNRIPAELRDGDVIRRYLDAGGKLVVAGPNPWAYVEDPATGEVTAIDFTIPARIFGMRFGEPQEVNGYYATHPTDAGRAAGLRTSGVAYGAVDLNQAIEPLAINEFGRASAWRKSYGGHRGSGLVQLALPRQRVVDYAEFVAAIEQGIGW